MADNKKYYYLKLKENFFESDSMILLENMKDGYLYSNILLKLYLRSLKDNGRLMLNSRIPYNSQMIASVVRHQVGTVEKALEIFENLGFVERLDSGAIYMLDIQNFIGESSTEADRKREYRARIEREKTDICQDKLEDKNPPEIRDRDKDRDKDRDINYQHIADMYNATCVSFPKLTKLSDKRKKAIKARLRVYSEEDFQKLFQMAEASSFLKGQNNRNWSATFDWMIADSNMAKVLDGNYADKNPAASSYARSNQTTEEEQRRINRERYKAECKKYGLDQPVPGAEEIWG